MSHPIHPITKQINLQYTSGGYYTQRQPSTGVIGDYRAERTLMSEISRSVHRLLLRQEAVQQRLESTKSETSESQKL